MAPSYCHHWHSSRNRSATSSWQCGRGMTTSPSTRSESESKTADSTHSSTLYGHVAKASVLRCSSTWPSPRLETSVSTLSNRGFATAIPSASIVAVRSTTLTLSARRGIEEICFNSKGCWPHVRRCGIYDCRTKRGSLAALWTTMC